MSGLLSSVISISLAKSNSDPIAAIIDLISDASISDGVPPPKKIEGTVARSPICLRADLISAIKRFVYELVMLLRPVVI